MSNRSDASSERTSEYAAEPGSFSEVRAETRVSPSHTAATPDLEPAWLEQLAPSGLVEAPLVLAPGLAYVVRGTVTEGVFHGRLTRAAYFMPLRAEGEAGAGEGEALPPAGELRRLAAPWAGWFDRKRPRVSWLGFSQSLAFYGLLQGLEVFYQCLETGQAIFGVVIHGLWPPLTTCRGIFSLTLLTY